MNSNTLILHNLAHNGDLFVSRSFVRDLCEKLNGNVIYLHKYDPNYLFNDISLKEFKTQAFPIDDNEKRVYSTWYAAKNHRYMEGTGCTIQTLYKLFSEIYFNLGLPINSIQSYIPSINFEKYGYRFIERKPNTVLVCTNTPLSGQSSISDLGYLVNFLSKEFPNKIFYVTNKLSSIENRSNVIFTESILKTNNLIELSWFSTHCSSIIGRSSGPYTFSLLNKNLEDKVTFFEILYTQPEGNFDQFNFGLQKLGYNQNFINICARNSDETILNIISKNNDRL